MPSLGDHVPNVEGGNEVQVVPLESTYREIIEVLVAQAMTSQINLNMVPRLIL